MNDPLDAVMIAAVILMGILAVVLLVIMGAEMVITAECERLGYDAGGYDILLGESYCEYEPLRVYLDEILKSARPSQEGTSA